MFPSLRSGSTKKPTAAASAPRPSTPPPAEPTSPAAAAGPPQLHAWIDAETKFFAAHAVEEAFAAVVVTYNQTCLSNHKYQRAVQALLPAAIGQVVVSGRVAAEAVPGPLRDATLCNGALRKAQGAAGFRNAAGRIHQAVPGLRASFDEVRAARKQRANPEISANAAMYWMFLICSPSRWIPTVNSCRNSRRLPTAKIAVCMPR